VTGLVAGHRDRLKDDIVRGEEEGAEALALEFLESADGPSMVVVARIEEGDEKAGVDEDHRRL